MPDSRKHQVKKHDIFLSYSCANEGIVETVAAKLRARGLEVFLDKWNLVPGDDWQEELEHALSESCACAVFVGALPGPWQNKEMRQALKHEAEDAVYRVIPVVLPGGDYREAPLGGFLGQLSAVDFRRGVDDADALESLVRGITDAKNVEPGKETQVLTPLTQIELRHIDQKIEALATLRETLGDEAAEAAEAKLRQEREALEDRKRITVRGPTTGMTLTAFTGPHGEEIRAYYRALVAECKKLPLGIIDTRFISATGDDAIPLPDIYVNLEVVSPAKKLSEAGEGQERERIARPWALLLARGEGEDRRAVLEAVADDSHRRSVLLGDAGTGKTTFVHYLTYLLGQEDPAVPEALQGLLPVRLVLRDVAARHVPADAEKGTASMLWAALEEDLERRIGQTEAGGVFRALRNQTLKTGGFFLLDGLDEVPEARRRRKALLEAVVELAEEVGPKSRVLVTARPYAYADPRWNLKDFSTLSLAPFKDQQVKRFVLRWYEAARESLHWSPDEAEQRAKELSSAIGDRSYLGDLASRPLLLTLMATLHSSWGRLPDDRADLYEEVTQLMLGRWQRSRKTVGPDGEEVIEPSISQTLQVGEEAIRARLDCLAFIAHERQLTEEAQREESADISEAEVLTVFKPLLENVGPSKLLDYLRHRTGLLIERREGIYAFPHRSFQEYLAASYLAGRLDADLELRRRVHEDPRWWREVFLFAVGKARKGGLSRAAGTIRSMLPTPEEEEADEGQLRWRLVALAAEALVELRLLERAGEDLALYEGQFVGDVRHRLASLIAGGHLPPGERLVAGDALSRLGDPRPGVGVVRVGGEELPDLEWIELPAGTFTIGSEENENEQPLHSVKLPRFYLSRYPITNAQFRPFVESGGYQQRELWSEEGWLWRTGGDLDLNSVEENRDTWHFNLWRRPALRRTQPWFYGDTHWGAANRPVIVTWFEALAYTRWLHTMIQDTPWWRKRSAILRGYCVRLSSEVEWERAARGRDDRRWPWGEEFDPAKANTEEAKLGHTSAVGMFPAGRSLAGLDDLAGNVFEWTRSVYRKYPYDSTDGRENISGLNSRVVRGGIWLGIFYLARCTHRSRMPETESEIVGFRCAIAPAN